jgi:hypothetical protein
MGKYKYLIETEVANDLGQVFCIRTMDTCRYFYPFWNLIEYKMKSSPEVKIEPFHSLVFPKYNKRRPIVCIGNDNKADAIRAHRNLYMLIKKGYVMGP